MNVSIKLNFYFFFVFSVPPSRRTPAAIALELFEEHQGTHILQVSHLVIQSIEFLTILDDYRGEVTGVEISHNQ